MRRVLALVFRCPGGDHVQLVARNVTAGCGDGNDCPLTNANRGQMATFVVKTFNLQ